MANKKNKAPIPAALDAFLRSFDKAEGVKYSSFLRGGHAGNLNSVVRASCIDYLVDHGIRSSPGVCAAIASVLVKSAMILIHNKVKDPVTFLKGVVDDAKSKVDALDAEVVKEGN